MDKETIYDILCSESEPMTLQDIEDIMNEELDKAPEEMDTDLVDLCLNTLIAETDKQLNKRRVRIRFTRVLVAAIVFVLVTALSIPVCAKYFHMNVPDGLVAFYGDCFNIDISGKDTVEDVYAMLRQDGIENAVLPDIFTQGDMHISEYENVPNNDYDMLTFSFKENEIEGKIIIHKYRKTYYFQENQHKLPADYQYTDYIDFPNMRVLVFNNEEEAFINYFADNIEYHISINCDYETAYHIAETL